MLTAMQASLAAAYKSRCQSARVVTEAWGEQNLYCVACSSNGLTPLPRNSKAYDFQCPRCSNYFQLKSSLRKQQRENASRQFLSHTQYRGPSTRPCGLAQDDKLIVCALGMKKQAGPLRSSWHPQRRGPSTRPCGLAQDDKLIVCALGLKKKRVLSPAIHNSH
jgi:hypothetical protein